MILDQKKTTLAYRCPECGGVPTSMVGAFSLSGDLFKLKCSCGGSHLTVEKTLDDKIRLTTPCLVCPSPHSYIISKNVFFGSDIFVIPCSLCGIDICFIGKENEVSKAVKHSNDEIVKLLGDASIEQLKTRKESDFTDPMIFDVITYVISDLHEEGKIYCRCPEGHGDYTSTIYDHSVEVKCKNCGASITIEANSTQGAEDFLQADELRLN
ncbi:MAG: hypothetical protein IJ437_04740 [Clostridia bacterium]|nr:hypothetical protein [Clostridia bacterium]